MSLWFVVEFRERRGEEGRCVWTLGSDGRLLLCVSRRPRSEAAAARFSRRRRCSSAPTMKAVRFFLPSCLDPQTYTHLTIAISTSRRHFSETEGQRERLSVPPFSLSLSLARREPKQHPRSRTRPAQITEPSNRRRQTHEHARRRARSRPQSTSEPTSGARPPPATNRASERQKRWRRARAAAAATRSAS